MKPIVSIYGPANRPELWMPLYNKISKTSVPFELIFVGNVKPTFDLPDNFTFIYSTVKPAQCTYIATVHCKGEYLMNIADDLTPNDNALDNILEFHKDNMSISSFQNLDPYDGTVVSHGFFGRKGDIIVPIGSFIHRSLWDKTYIDKRFVGLYWDIDIAMQVYALGGTVNVCPDATFTERGVRGLKGRLCCLKEDKPFVYSLWHTTGNPKTGHHLKERSSPPELFEWTDDILEVSQGRTNNRWT